MCILCSNGLIRVTSKLNSAELLIVRERENHSLETVGVLENTQAGVIVSCVYDVSMGTILYSYAEELDAQVQTAAAEQIEHIVAKLLNLA